MSALSETMRQQITYNDVIAKLQAELTEQHQYACEQAVLTRKMQDKVVAQRAGLERIHLPVDAVEQAFFFDTNQPFFHDWVKNCCLHIPIFRVPTSCHNRE